jgi:hypothetical protein
MGRNPATNGRPTYGNAKLISSKPDRVADPHHFNADPNPAFHLNADPDSAFHLNADPDPAFHFNADPDPAPLQSDENLRPPV